jgi:hypothetical protein
MDATVSPGVLFDCSVTYPVWWVLSVSEYQQPFQSGDSFCGRGDLGLAGKQSL